jgi:serine/threonine protein kinase/tetratricopeptide (TPR) repeat protein
VQAVDESLDRLESLFVATLQKAPANRAAYLDQACVDDPALRERVEALLRAQEAAGSFLESPASSPVVTVNEQPVGEGPGTIIGPYKLLQQIGEGGMGTVWMAQQTEPVKRQVAVKLIKAGMDSRQVIARFEAERQALALMDHVNIARVLDAGTTGTGRPYFVMDLVKGVPITRYCDEHHLTPRQRLELFIPVCQAVQHAHQKGIIHRDLKPSNVLVALYDGKPVPKVIDFGVAKAAEQQLTDKTLVTGFGNILGTLEYMSPEQAEINQLDIDTRSDIYSLGVLLYELLTGSPPFTTKDLEKAGMLEMLRVIREQEPSKPSTKLSTAEGLPTLAANRGTEPAKLTKLVRGELDWIVMKALEKDRSRRYETANGFALDVQRYLADEPIMACPPSVGYRLRKFVRRNRGPVLAASLLVLTLIGGVAGTTVGLVRANERAEGERWAKDSAEKRLAQIEKGINILSSIFENLDPMAEESEGRPLRMILGDRIDQAAAELEGEAVGDPLVVARLQDRLGRTYMGLGQGSRAEAIFARAADTRRAQLGPDDPLTLESRHRLAAAREAAGRSAEAIQLFEEVHKAQRRVLGPNDLSTLATLHDLGAAYWRSGKLNDAVGLLERVRNGRTERLGEAHDLTLSTEEKLAGVYLSVGRNNEAIALAEKVFADRRKAHGEDHPKAIVAMGRLAYIYQGTYRMKDALALYEHARDQIVPKLGDYHPMTLQILQNLGQTLRAYRRLDEAIPLLEQVRERELMVLGGQHPSTIATSWNLAEAYKAAGDLNKAVAACQQALVVLEKLQFQHSHAEYVLDELALCHENLKEFDQAELARRKELQVIERKHGADSGLYALQLIRIGSAVLRQKRPSAAEPDLRQALAILERHPDPGEMHYARSLLGIALADQGRFADAEPLLIEAYQGMKSLETEHKGKGRLYLGRQTDALKRLVQLSEEWGKPEQAARWQKELDAQIKDEQPEVKPKAK